MKSSKNFKKFCEFERKMKWGFLKKLFYKVFSFEESSHESSDP